MFTNIVLFLSNSLLNKEIFEKYFRKQQYRFVFANNMKYLQTHSIWVYLTHKRIIY